MMSGNVYTVKFSGLLAAAVLALGIAGGAQAATVTPLGGSTNLVGNTADVFAAGYGANTPAGATWAPKDPTVTPPPAQILFKYSSPFLNTPVADTQDFFSVGAETDDGEAARGPVTRTFADAQSAINVLWGSIDTPNTIKFFKGATNVFTYTGADLATALGLTPTGQDPRFFNYVELVRFDGFGQDGFDKIEFSSVTPSFEFGLAPVAVPAAGMLLLTALGGMVVLRRRKAA